MPRKEKKKKKSVLFGPCTPAPEEVCTRHLQYVTIFSL